ncbi:MAG: hypothetical protein IV100_05670 [Myxococcales bacterium]|nr:hypothetical protein [Myxococcales bacterium]
MLGSTTTTTTANTTTVTAVAGCDQIAVPSAASDVAWIVPTAIAAILFLVVVVLAVLLVRRPSPKPATVEMRTARDVKPVEEDDGRYGSVADVRAQPSEAGGTYSSAFEGMR